MALTAQQEYFDKLLQTEDVNLRELHARVVKSMQEQESLVENLQRAPLETPTFGQRVADRVAEFGGSWTFILSFFGVLVLWIGINTIALLGAHFDPYPFILLNLVLSCLAALQAPVIMMSQNRQEEKDRQRAANDYLVNLKAECEIRNLHDKMDFQTEAQLHRLLEVQVFQMQMLDRLNDKLNRLARGLPVSEAEEPEIPKGWLEAPGGG